MGEVIERLPSQAYLKEALRYNRRTGKLTWKMRPRSHFASDRGHTIFNKLWAGKPAFDVDHSCGYKTGNIRSTPGDSGKVLYAHRIIWKIVYDEEPEEIDHKNGRRADNRLCNLRPSSSADNKKNTKLRSDNTSGICGVSKVKGRWQVRIFSRYHSSHPTREAAVATREALEKQHGFSPSHGRRQWDEGGRVARCN